MDVSAIEEETRQIFIHDCLHFLGTAILFYDHIITFDLEYTYLWARPKNKSAYWFFANRYAAFFGNLFVTAFEFSTLSPQAFSLYRQLLLVADQVLVIVLLTLRVYALFERSKRVLWFLVVFAVILFGLAAWTLAGQHSFEPIVRIGCHRAVGLSTAIRLAVAWEALLIYDSVLFVMTLVKTWKTSRVHSFTKQSIPLVSLLLRDGAIYFAIMALSNLSNIFTFYTAPSFLKGALSTFASGLSITLVSRLMLNLHIHADGIYTTKTGVLYTEPNVNELTDVVLDTLYCSSTSRDDP